MSDSGLKTWSQFVNLKAEFYTVFCFVSQMFPKVFDSSVSCHSMSPLILFKSSNVLPQLQSWNVHIQLCYRLICNSKLWSYLRTSTLQAQDQTDPDLILQRLNVYFQGHKTPLKKDPCWGRKAGGSSLQEGENQWRTKGIWSAHECTVTFDFSVIILFTTANTLSGSVRGEHSRTWVKVRVWTPCIAERGMLQCVVIQPRFARFCHDSHRWSTWKTSLMADNLSECMPTCFLELIQV